MKIKKKTKDKKTKNKAYAKMKIENDKFLVVFI